MILTNYSNSNLKKQNRTNSHDKWFIFTKVHISNQNRTYLIDPISLISRQSERSYEEMTEVRRFFFWKMTFSSSILLAQKKYPQDEPLNSCMVRMWSIAPRTFSERDREILVTNDLLYIWLRMHIDSSVRWFVPKIISHLWKWIPLKDTTLFCCYCVWSLHRSCMIKHFSPFGSICLVSFARVIGQQKITNSGKIVKSSFSIINCSTIFQIST